MGWLIVMCALREVWMTNSQQTDTVRVGCTETKRNIFMVNCSVEWPMIYIETCQRSSWERFVLRPKTSQNKALYSRQDSSHEKVKNGTVDTMRIGSNLLIWPSPELFDIVLHERFWRIFDWMEFSGSIRRKNVISLESSDLQAHMGQQYF